MISRAVREDRRAQRSKRLWAAHQAAGIPEPEPGTTFVPMTRAGRLHQRNLELRCIRRDIERLPEGERPVFSRKGSTLVVDYGIYQERYDLRSFRIDLYGSTLDGDLLHYESESKSNIESHNRFLADDAKKLLQLIQVLRARLAFERGEIGPEQLAAQLRGPQRRLVKFGDLDALARCAIGIGELRERILVRQLEPAALKAKRSRAGARWIAAQRSERLRKRRQALVAAEIERQRNTGMRVNYGNACTAVAKAEDCDVRSIKNTTVNLWTARARRE